MTAKLFRYGRPLGRCALLVPALGIALSSLVLTTHVHAQTLAKPARPIARVLVRGNRKVEDDAVFAVLGTKAGRPLSRGQIAVDVRAIWGLGYFDDVRVHLLPSAAGPVVVFAVREKPSVRKIIVAGNDEIDLDKINEVLDLKKGAILDVSAIKRNMEKIRDLYVEKGFYLVDLSYRVRQVSRESVDIIYQIEEHAKVTIRRITIVGNKYVSDDAIKSVIGTQEGGFFSFLTSSGTYQQSAFERDLVMISALYYDEGFINVKVSEPQISLSADKRFMYITLHVTEGQRFHIGKIDVRGDMIVPRDQLLAMVQTKSGQLFNRSRLGKDVMDVANRYKDAGYAYANITPLTNVDVGKRIVDLTLDVQKGPVVHFERIAIRGNNKTSDKVIRRELRVAEGDRFSQTLLDRSKARVTALGFFESVDLSTQRGSSDDQIEVTIEVKERPTGTFQIGAGFSSVENFIAQAQISQNNLFGRGQRLSLQAQVSSLRQLFALSFVEPYFLDTSWTFGVDLFNSLRAYESFNRKSIGGSLTWGYPVLDDVYFYLTYKAEQVDVTTGSGGLLFGSGYSTPLPAGVQLANLFRSGFTSSARFSVQWDTRNNRLFPSKGMFHAAWAEQATSLLASQNRFTRYGAFARFYYPIWGPFILKLNSEIGVIVSPDKQGVPIFERYFVGGIFDVRGFRPRSLGPRIQVPVSPDPNAALFSFNKGGNKQLLFNAEIEFPIFEKVGIRGVVFSDAGMAYDDDQAITLGRLRHSWGFGLRWFSPIGPLRFEWGLPFSPAPGEDPIVFEFTIGNFF